MNTFFWIVPTFRPNTISVPSTGAYSTKFILKTKNTPGRLSNRVEIERNMRFTSVLLALISHNESIDARES